MLGSRSSLESIHVRHGCHDKQNFLTAAFALRHQVFCQDTGLFLSHNQDELESDEFDVAAEHFLVQSLEGASVLGTVRLVKYDPSLGFPTGKYYAELDHGLQDYPKESIGEISRLCVTRNILPPQRHGIVPNHRSGYFTYSLVLLHLFKRIYQASRQLGLKYWLVSMEDSLCRLLLKYHLCFSPITSGYIEYHGKVKVFLAEIDELERVLRVQDRELLSFFQSGDVPVSH